VLLFVLFYVLVDVEMKCLCRSIAVCYIVINVQNPIVIVRVGVFLSRRTFGASASDNRTSAVRDMN
jgi:hypothetical protein